MSAVLQCQVHPNSIASWERRCEKSRSVIYTDGLEINPSLSNKSKLKIVGKITNGEYNMQINNVSAKEKGIYKCVQINYPDMIARETFVTLIIQDEPFLFFKNDNPITTNEGKNITIVCSWDSYHSTVVDIEKDGLSIDTHCTSSTCSHTFANIRRNDYGLYVCNGYTNHGIVQASVDIIVHCVNIDNFKLNGIYVCNAENGIPDVHGSIVQSGKVSVLLQDYKITVSTFGQTIRMKGYKISLQGFTLTEKDFTTYSFWIQNEIGEDTFSVKLLAKDYDFKTQSGYGSWLAIVCLVGGIIICSIASNIYCYLKRRSRINVMLETYQEDHYDEIGTINYNNVVFEQTADVTRENNDISRVTGYSDIPLSVESESSKESSLERLTGFSQSSDGYENPYQSINPENNEMHTYSNLVSNIYQNTIIFPASAGTKNTKVSNIAEETSRTPWLIIYTKKQQAGSINRYENKNRCTYQKVNFMN
ncbi:unnamed protein product [Mytilus coruscus]|uniref:Immunoglobulin domain-containing protein n=1 Tax=Mytilus coruscus TaxID=42192 RepID=A0A6J7ZVH2_MYTCO|nr:unnamed protein product [Mytilus coruscus]